MARDAGGGRALTDAFATLPHYARHLLPIWDGLGRPGRFCGEGLAGDWLRARDVEVSPLGGSGPVLVASYADSLRVRGRPVILLEHGAGQDYGGRDPSNPGGTGREHIALFLCTNESVAERNRDAYPDTLSVVIGAPCVRERTRPEGRTVALAFHWRLVLAPEGDWAFDHFSRVLPSLAERFDLIGHGHPRAWRRLERFYRSAGIEPVQELDDVLDRASVVCFDNTSAGFEAAISRPVVLMDSPKYRREVNHGLRFWDWADIGGRTSDPDALGDLIQTALEGDGLEQVRGNMARSVYPYLASEATSRAVTAIQETNLIERAMTGNRAGRVEPPGRLPMSALTRAGVAQRDIGNLKRAWSMLGRADRMAKATALSDADVPTARKIVDDLLGRSAPVDLGPLPDATEPLTPAPLVSQVPSDPLEWVGTDAPKARAALEVERKGPRRPQVLEALGRLIVGRN